MILAPEEAIAPTDGDAAFVAEAGDCDVDPRSAARYWPDLGELYRPARVDVLLRGFCRPVGPDLGRSPAHLDRLLLSGGVALLWRRHKGSIDDLPAHWQIAALSKLPVERGEQRIERAGADQLLAEQPDCVLIRRNRAQIKAQEPQPAQPVADEELHAGVTDGVLCREDQNLEYRNRIVCGRPSLSLSPYASAFCSAGRNTSKSTTRLIVSSGSPQSDNRFNSSDSPNNPA